MKKTGIILLLLFFCAFKFSFAQCPTPAFSVTPSCSLSPVNVTNNTANANSYNWDFCSGELGWDSITISSGTPFGFSSSVRSIYTIKDNGNWYVFFCKFPFSSDMYRADYGNSLNNIPNIVALGNPGNLLNGPTGLIIKKEGNNWYGLMAAAGNNAIIRLNFGSSITNVPVATSLGNFSNKINSPRSLKIEKENDSIIVVVSNYNSKNLALIKFGSSLSNTPTAANVLLVSGLSSATNGIYGIDIVKDCDKWYGVTLSDVNGLVYRVNFGTQLFDTIAQIDTLFSNSSLYGGGTEVELKYEGGEYKCFFATTTGKIWYTNFGNKMSNTPAVPVLKNSLGQIFGLNITSDSSRWYGVFARSDNFQLRVITFLEKCSATPMISTVTNLSGIQYSVAGNYKITLVATDSLQQTTATSLPVSFYNKPSPNFGLQNICWPASEQFTDSTIAGSGTIAFWQWNFGNGVNSALQNPSYTYSTPGTYQIKLVVGNSAGCIDSISKSLQIYEKPNTNFAMMVNCSSDSAIAIDSSTYISTPVNQWSWYWGDGTTSTSQNPKHLYANGGGYDILQIVTNTAGCRDTLQKTVSIKYSPHVSVTVQNDCLGDTTKFINLTTEQTPDSLVSYLWNFGDIVTSGLKNPQHKYAAPGNYLVSFYTIATNGCSDSIKLPVRIVSPPVAGFSFIRACTGSATMFTNASYQVGSDSIIAYSWNFGDGNSSTQKNAIHVYSAAGNYTVTMCAFSGYTCNACMQKTVKILQAPVVAIHADSVCANLTTHFTDLSTTSGNQHMLTWKWFFGDGDSSVQHNPTHIFSDGGSYPLSLTVTTDSGCIATGTNTAKVFFTPTADFINGQTCDNTVSFTDNSVIGGGDTLNTWLWNFGDSQTSLLKDPVHQYASISNYNVTLTVKSQNQCTGFVTKSAGLKYADFTLNNPVCMLDTFGGINISTGFVNYEWDFCAGDLTLDSPKISIVGALVNSASPYKSLCTVKDGNHWYSFFTRYFTPFDLFRADFGSSLENNPTITNLGTLSVNGTVPGLVAYNENGNWYLLEVNSALNALVRTSFGNSLGNTPSNRVSLGNLGGKVNNPYGIKLAKENGALIAVVTNYANKNIALVNFGTSITNTPTTANTLLLNNLFNSATTGLAGFDLIQDCCSWIGVATSDVNGKIYKINFGETLFDTIAAVQVLFNDSIKYPKGSVVQLKRENGEYKCFFTSIVANSGSIWYTTFGNSTNNSPTVPTALTSLGKMYSLNIVNDGTKWYGVFTDNTNYLLDVIKFPDPCSASSAISNQANANTSYYTQPGNFRISLNAFDANGCVKTTSKAVAVKPSPEANFGYQNYCLGETTQFTDSSVSSGVGLQSTAWYFGDGGSSSAISPSYTYTNPGNYWVYLIKAGNNGCADTAKKNILIAEKPVSNFTSSVGCQRDSAIFISISTFVADSIQKWYWNFGGVLTDSTQNAVEFIDTSGNITVSLIVANTHGCTDTNAHQIFLKPKPTYNIDIKNTCVGRTVSFTNNSTVALGNVITSTHWNFGDGQTSNLLNTTHTYPSVVANYNVMLYSTVSNGCTDSILLPAHIATAPHPDFIYPTLCQNDLMTFHDFSTGTSDSIIKWHWDFGVTSLTNDTSNLPNPTYIYPNTGSYTISLTVVSPTYCDTTISKTTLVLPSPVVNITADAVCFTDTTHFTNTSSIALPFTITSYDWNFGDQTTHDTAQVPKHNFNLPGLYQTVLTVTTNASCYTRDTVIAVVHAKPSADYTPAQVSCALTPTTFQNQSVIASPDLLSKFIWNFGDNSIDSVQNPVHFFSQQGKYAVSLTVTSNFGCASTALDTVEVFAALQADFIDTNFCIGDVTKFTDVTPSLSIVSWQWSFGDGSLPTAVQNPMHTFSIPSIYQVTLKVQNAIGCVAYVAKNVQIVQQPVADFTKLLLCVGSYFTPVDSSYSPNDPITRWQWNINGSLFNSYQPSYYFADTGTYSATLVITSQHGCSDSVSKMVQVKPNAHADFISFPLYGEAPLDVTFTNQSTGAATYWWSFGDGSYTADVSPLHTYTNNGTYTILLAATSQYGCTDTTTRNFTVVPTDLDISVDEVRTQQTSLADGSILLTVTAKMSNVGTRLVTNMQLYATVGSGGMIEEDWNGALQSGQIMDYIFTSQFVISAANANSYVCVEAKNVNHGETELRYDNNRQCAPMNGNIQLAGPIPNPAFNQSSLGIVLPKAGKITLGIYDAIGNTVIPETEISLAAGRTDYQLPVGQLLAAEYFIKVKYLDDVLIKKLVVR